MADIREAYLLTEALTRHGPVDWSVARAPVSTMVGSRSTPAAAGRDVPARDRLIAMYAQLLRAVLDDETELPPPAQGTAHSAGPLAELIRLRHTMEKHAGHNSRGWALQAVADQLAYDVALVRLGRRRGVPVDIDGFDVPERGRARLEQAMLDKGVNLPAHSGTAEGNA